MPMTPAKEVKLKIEQIMDKLTAIRQEARQLENDSNSVPGYIEQFGRYMNVKMAQILFTTERLYKKLPEHFQGEG